MIITNPFEYEAANNLSDELILDVYIEDHNYSRFIQSKRNIFLVGERGSGKTMTLLYNSFRIQYLKAMKDGLQPSFDQVGVYVSCNNPLMRKQEYLLLNPVRAAILSEHYLVLSMLYGLADAMKNNSQLLDAKATDNIRSEIEYTLGWQLPADGDVFDAIQKFVGQESVKTQRHINRPDSDAFYESALTFSAGLLPIIVAAKNIPSLRDTHYLFMIDDAHDLNPLQARILNSWIAFRDHTDFSFKVATTKLGHPDFLTASNGTILEGHDFTRVDMERPFQNESSEYGQLARLIIQRRLERIQIASVLADDYFPSNPEFEKDLEQSKEKVRGDYLREHPDSSAKQIADHVYKYARADFFRQRSSKANRPPYSGFDTLTHLSTGVVRNLLEPCYWMYERVQSSRAIKSKGATITVIPPQVQTDIILERSDRLWDAMRNDLDKIAGCSKEEAKKVYLLFDNLATHLRDRLLHHRTEPRAIAFTISTWTLAPAQEQELKRLLDIAQKAQMLYTRNGPAKDDGSRETYYVPNRMLWPARGLDPNGQHARVSLKASVLLGAANGKQFPQVGPNSEQGKLFDE